MRFTTWYSVRWQRYGQPSGTWRRPRARRSRTPDEGRSGDNKKGRCHMVAIFVVTTIAGFVALDLIVRRIEKAAQMFNYSGLLKGEGPEAV